MRVTGLNVFPIKGCRGVPVTAVGVERLGFVGDRFLMLVDRDNCFISQREVPGLATIEPSFDGDNVVVQGPGCDPLAFSPDRDGAARTVSVWGKGGIVAADQGDIAAAWFSAALRERCRLVCFGRAAHNPVDPEYSPRPDAETTFTDGYPIMAVLQESLDDLNARLLAPVSMARFRPSIVVTGAPAWSEDHWKEIQIGELHCEAVKPCARCVVTTTDQATGARHAAQEPLRTLATFRTMPGLGAIFGQNLVHRGTGTLRVGDEVRLR